MAKILVDIPDDLYNEIKQTQMFISGMRSGKTLLYTLMSSVANGAQIPKGCGRLIDADKIVPIALEDKSIVLEDTDLLSEHKRELSIRYLFSDICKLVEKQPTIIEADKEGD